MNKKEILEKFAKKLKDRKNYPFLKENCPSCNADRTIFFEVIDKIKKELENEK